MITTLKELEAEQVSGIIGEDFSFWIPLSKAQGASRHKRPIQGIATTEDKDLDDEIVHKGGLDFDYFLKSGYYNYDHQPGPSNKVGRPTEARVDERGFFNKGFLYHCPGLDDCGDLHPKPHERADELWGFINVLEKGDPGRKLGQSIEGKIIERCANRIKRAWVRAIALTEKPVNTHTWTEIAKSLQRTPTFCLTTCSGACECFPIEMMRKAEHLVKALMAGGEVRAGSTGGEALKKESLKDGLVRQIWGPCHQGCYDARTKRFAKGMEGVLTHMHVCKGYSLDQSSGFLTSLLKARHTLEGAAACRLAGL